MNQSITALAPSAPVRDPDAAAPILEHDTLEQAKFWSSDQGASFGEVLDAVNPLHHIPVVSTIYRAISGDTIGFGPRLIGAAIFGGPLGLILAGIVALVEEMSGGTVTEHALALVEDLTGGGAVAAAPTTQPPITEALTAAVPMPIVVSAQSAGIQTTDTESKRIAQTLLLAQRAQANLLLASLQAYDAVKSRPDRDEDRDDGEDRGPHSNLPAAGVGSTWYADAMMRALDKYRTDHATPTGGP